MERNPAVCLFFHNFYMTVLLVGPITLLCFSSLLNEGYSIPADRVHSVSVPFKCYPGITITGSKK